jgi:hypothetical protein
MKAIVTCANSQDTNPVGKNLAREMMFLLSTSCNQPSRESELELGDEDSLDSVPSGHCPAYRYPRHRSLVKSRSDACSADGLGWGE